MEQHVTILTIAKQIRPFRQMEVVGPVPLTNLLDKMVRLA